MAVRAAVSLIHVLTAPKKEGKGAGDINWRFAVKSFGGARV